MDELKSYTLDEVTQMVLDRGDQAHDEFLFQQWYRGIMDDAIISRVQAGQSQQAIAEKLGTTQSSIARLENDRNGSPSARRIWNYLVACGIMPLVETRPVEEIYDLLAGSNYQPLAASAHYQPYQIPAKPPISTSFTITVRIENTTLVATPTPETPASAPADRRELLVPAQPAHRPVLALGSGNQLYPEALFPASSQQHYEPERVGQAIA